MSELGLPVLVFCIGLFGILGWPFLPVLKEARAKWSLYREAKKQATMLARDPTNPQYWRKLYEGIHMSAAPVPPLQPLSRIDMPTNTMGLPRAKRVWYTMETEDGEFMQIEGDVLSINVEMEQEMYEVNIDSQFAPVRHMAGSRHTRMHVEFNGGFRLHKIDTKPDHALISTGVRALTEGPVVTETVKSEDITPEVMRRYKLE